MRKGDSQLSVVSLLLLAFGVSLLILIFAALGLSWLLALLNSIFPVIPALGFGWSFFIVYIINVIAGIVIMSRVPRVNP
jgi:hypothetical protein